MVKSNTWGSPESSLEGSLAHFCKVLLSITISISRNSPGLKTEHLHRHFDADQRRSGGTGKVQKGSNQYPGKCKVSCPQMWIRCWVPEDSSSPSKILGTVWDKKDDMLEMQVPDPPDNQPLTKRGILSHLASILRPTRDDFAHNCEREADLQGCMWWDKGVEQGSFRPAEERVD